MTLSLDCAILAWAGCLFVLFFILQVVVFRMVHPDAVLRWIMNIFMMVSIAHAAGLALLYSNWKPDYPGGILLPAIVSYFIFGLVSFVYILCVFGPSETSIRIRLVRELVEMKGGRLSHDELLKRYNGRLILERRLDRLIQAGEIAKQDGKYVLVNKANAFFLIDMVAGFIRQCVGTNDKR